MEQNDNVNDATNNPTSRPTFQTEENTSAGNNSIRFEIRTIAEELNSRLQSSTSSQSVASTQETNPANLFNLLIKKWSRKSKLKNDFVLSGQRIVEEIEPEESEEVELQLAPFK